MPLLIPVLVAGGVGFGGGFLASNGLKRLGQAALIAGGAYLIYRQVAK